MDRRKALGQDIDHICNGLSAGCVALTREGFAGRIGHTGTGNAKGFRRKPRVDSNTQASDAASTTSQLC